MDAKTSKRPIAILQSQARIPRSVAMPPYSDSNDIKEEAETKKISSEEEHVIITKKQKRGLNHEESLEYETLQKFGRSKDQFPIQREETAVGRAQIHRR